MQHVESRDSFPFNLLLFICSLTSWPFLPAPAHSPPCARTLACLSDHVQYLHITSGIGPMDSNYSFIYLFIWCGGCVPSSHVEVRRQLVGMAFSFYSMFSKDQTQVVWLMANPLRTGPPHKPHLDVCLFCSVFYLV